MRLTIRAAAHISGVDQGWVKWAPTGKKTFRAYGVPIPVWLFNRLMSRLLGRTNA